MPTWLSSAALLIETGLNPGQRLEIAAAVFVVLSCAMLLVRYVLLKHCRLLAERTAFHFDDLFLCYVGKVRVWFCLVVAFFFAVHRLPMPAYFHSLLRATLLVSFTVQGIFILEGVAGELVERYIDRDGKPGIPRVFSMLVQMTLWSVGFLLVLGNLGINVTSLIAGLGIGGIAMSLALQNVIADIFSSFSIAVDKPFEEGDYVVVGSHKGTIKHIGIKSTRIQALQGEEIIISNNELIASRIQNFKRLESRRIEFAFSVPYETPLEKLEKLGSIVRDVVTRVPEAEFDRAHVRNFEDSGLHCEAVFFVRHNDYNRAMDIQQAITLGVLKSFSEEGIAMAYPTRVVYQR